MQYKDTSWHAATFTDAMNVASGKGYRVQAASIHGKMFLAYDSAVDRLHVRDAGSANVRRCGLATPAAAPTGANEGAGTFTGTRYYRVRYTVQSAGVTLRRSEPSAVLTFAPSGTGAGVRVTKPATISESETHWELEASLDNANFYVLATTVVGTTTYDDETAYSTGYSDGELSADSGDYTVPPSCKYLVADDDRLLMGGSWEDATLSARVTWTPVYNDPGEGNDERIPISTDNFLDLDTYEGGELTGLSRTVNGYIYAFKRSAIYQMVRTGIRSQAYQAFCMTKQIGALPGSIIEGLDQNGNPCLYFVDQNLGPHRIGVNGIQACGRDILTTWRTLNVDATVPVLSVFYPYTRQAHWWLATGAGTVPDLKAMLQTDLSRQTEHDGIRRGWTTHTGDITAATAVCMFADNIESGAARSYALVPLIGNADGDILLCDTGTDDNGTAYSARIVTAPTMAAGILNRFGIRAGALVAEAATGVSLSVKAIRDFGAETVTSSATLTASGSETDVIVALDTLNVSNCRALQIEFVDKDTPTGTWNLERFDAVPTEEETA